MHRSNYQAMKTGGWKAKRLSSISWECAQDTGSGSSTRDSMSSSISTKLCGRSILTFPNYRRRHTFLWRRRRILKLVDSSCMLTSKTSSTDPICEPILPSGNSSRSTLKYLSRSLTSRSRLQASKDFNWVDVTSSMCHIEASCSSPWVRWTSGKDLTHTLQT